MIMVKNDVDKTTEYRVAVATRDRHATSDKTPVATDLIGDVLVGTRGWGNFKITPLTF